MHTYFSVFLFGAFFVGLLNAQVPDGTPCETPTKQYGLCINVYSCTVVTDILSSNRITVENRNYVKSLSCGYKNGTPLVCCPQASTRGNIQPVPVDDGGLNDEDTNLDSGVFLAPPNCGQSNASLPKVVGGVPAKLGEFPWIVSLGYKNSRNPSQPKWLCGGTLITTKHILTAAHCVYNRNDLYIARVAELDLFDDNDGAHPVDIPIALAKIHESYSPVKFSGDIAILTLSRTIVGIENASPICLPWESDKRNRTFLNNQPFVAGWGALYFNGPSSSTLQLATIPVVDNSLCAKAYSNKAVVDGRIICAGYPNGEKDACQGDSGGPLMYGTTSSNERGLRFFLIGVVSYGFRCAEEGYPGVYTRVTHFLPWIQKNIA